MASEDFDLLVVASGYFARPYIPNIPGLSHFPGRVVHSAALQKGSGTPLNNEDDTVRGNVVVIGGSMSGVEAASAIALDMSSSMLCAAPVLRHRAKQTVHHVHSRPFWTLPTYLPHETPEDTITFLPLDLAMYDLGRRPPGPVEYALGPLPEEKAAKTNDYFSTLLGAEYERLGHTHGPSAEQEARFRPPWVAIGNDYAEFVRSGAIETTMGRAVSVQPDPDTGLASIKIETPDGQSKTVDNVETAVMATGFTPFESLSFLPGDVLSALEYTTNDPFLPLVLDKGGTLRSEMPDIGFVGFYRGPYWGVMEMQARLLGEAWAGKSQQALHTENQREGLRVLRHPTLNSRRSQFPMGDYVGLMESFAKDLGINRTGLSSDDGQSGPVVPSRYLHDQTSCTVPDQYQITRNAEAQRTLNSLQSAFVNEHSTAQAAAASAIFRALHGTWKFSQWVSAADKSTRAGSVAFHPRYPSILAYDREYVCEEFLEPNSTDNDLVSGWRAVSIFRLSEAGTARANARIGIWTLDVEASAKSSHADQTLHLTPFHREKKNGEYVPGEYVIYASSADLTDTGDSAGRAAQGRYQYTFHFKGVAISTWECVDLGDAFTGGESDSESRSVSRLRTVYERLNN